MIRPLPAVFALATLAVGFASPSARAADPPPAKGGPASLAQARDRFARGVKLYQEEDYRAALIEFNRAYELAPNWAVLYNVGQSYYELKDYADALQTLERYIALGGSKIPAERRNEVLGEIALLKGRVAHVTVDSHVAGADVSLDDVPLGQTPFASPQLVGMGRHTFRVSKAGYTPTVRTIDVAGGDTLHVTLDPIAVETTPLAAPHPVIEHVASIPPAAPPPATSPSFVPAYVTLGVGAAGLAVGAIFGGLAVHDRSVLRSECQGNACQPSSQGDIDAFSRDGAISTTGFIVGGAGVATAVVLYLLERRAGKETRAGARSLAPWIGAGNGGLAGTF